MSLNALPGVLHAEWSTKCTTEPDTAQTERVLTRLVDTASLDSRLHQSRKRVLHHIHVSSLFHPVLSLPVLHAQHFVVLGFTLRAWQRSDWFFFFDPRQYIMTTTDELLARLVSLENQAVQARRRQSSAEHALAAAQQRVQHLSSKDVATSTSAGVIDTRTLGKPKSFTGQTAEWTTWQFTFKAFACAAHPKIKEFFHLATRKGSEPVVNSDMTAELQSQSKQLHYMLVMIPSYQVLEIVRMGVAYVALGIRAGCWYQIRSDVAVTAEATIW